MKQNENNKTATRYLLQFNLKQSKGYFEWCVIQEGTISWCRDDKAGLTSSDVGDGGDEDGASVEADWLQAEGAGSEAVGRGAGEDVSLGIEGSATSSSFAGGDTLNCLNKKRSNIG